MSADKPKRTRAKKQATSSAPGEAAKAHEWLMDTQGASAEPIPENSGGTRNEKGRFVPGVSGNPKGKPKGSRTKLGEAFISDLQADWVEHGSDVITKVRAERPHEYLKVVASILPKELNVRVDPLEEMDDDELSAILAAARAAIRFHQEGGSDVSAPSGSQPSGLV